MWSIVQGGPHILVILISSVAYLGLSQETCDSVLGMGNGKIQDSQITASSWQTSFEPWNGRYFSSGNSAWCPLRAIEPGTYEYLQVEFKEMVNITHIIIAGLFNDGRGTKFTQKFKVEYKRTDGEEWRKFLNNRSETFLGNSDARETQIRVLSPPLLAARVRIIPFAPEVKEEVCLRVEFYGCQGRGVATYSSPIDARQPSEQIYDGQVSNGRLSRGLGILTDKILGRYDFATGIDNGFMTWSSESSSDASVMLLFEMDYLRNITDVTIHTVNNPSRQIGVFNRAAIHLSSDGAMYTQAPIVDTAIPTTDPTDTIAPIKINFPENTVTKFIKIVLFFSTNKLMVSEVTFTSSLDIRMLPSTQTSTSATTQKTTITSSTAKSLPDVTYPSSPPITYPADTTTKPPGDTAKAESANLPGSKTKDIDGSMIGMIVGVCLGVILVVSLIITICCVYQMKRKSAQNSRHHFCPTNSLSNGDKSYMGIPKFDSERGENSDYDQPMTTRPLPPCPSSGINGTHSSGYHSDSTHSPHYAFIPIDGSGNFGTPRHAFQPSPHSMHPCPQCAAGQMATLPVPGNNNMFLTARVSQTLPQQNILHVPIGSELNSYDIVQPETSSPYDSSNYRSSPAASLPNIQGTSGNSVYATHMLLPSKPLEDELPLISKSSLKFIEKIGAGQYGEVLLYELKSGPSRRSSEGSIKAPKYVAVKTLHNNAEESAKADFNREIRIMNRLRHDNIVQVLGLCLPQNSSDTLSVVTEYMAKGDLHKFLQSSVPEGTEVPGKQQLSTAVLMYIACQIARGMSYLEHMHITHRDLAARNCLISEDFHVKISDFGMSRELYSSQYYKVEGRVTLPIRWMAWESVLLGKFTIKSDIWSYGVTLWEIFTFARDLPFCMLSDDEVIANCMSYYRSDISNAITLHPPAHCPKEVYDMMQACWAHVDISRPSFKDLSAYLSRKVSLSLPAKSASEIPVTRLTAC